MRQSILILVLMLLLQVSCNKDKSPDTSGTVTIDNLRTLGQTYYVTGFLFSDAKLVTTRDNPPPDITVDSDGTNLVFQADNFKNSFFLSGGYADASAAKTAFDGLTTASVAEAQWEGLAMPVTPNQVWIYRSGSEHYAKIRIISTLTEVRQGLSYPYAECTFEWVYQPDGTLSFPGQ